MFSGGVAAAAVASQSMLALGALVLAGRGVTARAEALGAELAAARQLRDSKVRALRKSFDDAQTVSDRLVAASLGRLPARLDALLPLPTAAELRACPDREARVALWTALLERVFARAVVVCVAQCLAALTARVQISAIAGQVHFFGDEGAAGEEAVAEPKERTRAESLRAAFMERFVQLRETEHILDGGLGALTDAALSAARGALGGWPLTRPLRYGDVVQVLLAARTALLAAPLLQPEGGLAELVMPPSSETPGSDNVGELVLFFARRAVATPSFAAVFVGCLALRFAALNRRVLAMFPAAATATADAAAMIADGILPPKLGPQLAAAVGEEMSPVATVAALQELGSTQLVDRFMFSVFTGTTSSSTALSSLP